MDFNKYQDVAKTTAVYKEPKVLYCALGMGGETGEVLEHVKKCLRDDQGIMTAERRDKLKYEIGDVLWYIANLCSDLGLSLNDVAKANLNKLKKRKINGTLHGSGSDR